MAAGFPPCGAHVGFKVIDGALYNGSDFIEAIPFLCVSLDARKHTEIHVFIGISGPPLFGSAARVLTITDPLSSDYVDFGTDPFVPVRTSFFVAVPSIFHIQAAVHGAGGIPVEIVSDFLKRAFISCVIGNQYL